MTTHMTNNRLLGDIFEPFFDDVIGSTISSVKANRFSYSKEDESYYAEVEIPRFTKEDLSITLNDGILSIKGEINKDRVMRTVEKHYSVPRDAAPDKLEASLKHGVLRVSVPKSDKAKSLEIEIKETD